ncbi:MAG: hypothetical protein R8G66_18005 [Cytophagales bacterium]|nr:hypothetical protein [Cytophagales bacterium]
MHNGTFRLILILFCFWCYVIPAQAQSNATEEDNPMSSIRDLRRQIKFSADVRDFEEIKRLRLQIKDGFDSTKYLSLIEEEALMIDFMIEDYGDILKKIDAWPNDPFSGSAYYPEGPPDDGLFDHLLDIAVLDSTRLLAQIDQTDLKPYQNAFLKLYLRTFLSLSSNSAISDKGLEQWGQAYLEQFAPSPYDKFVKLKIRRKYVKNDWGASVGLGAGLGTFQGEFGNLVRFKVPVLIDLEANYKNLIGGLRLTVGEGTVRRDFEHDGFWDRGLKVNPFYGGLYLGYMLDLKPFRIIPYYDIGGTVITIAEQDLNDDNAEQDLGAFTHGPGLSLDFLPFSWTGFDNEVYHMGLRFKGGILFNNLENKDPSFESSYPYVGVSLILDFVGTELDLK